MKVFSSRLLLFVYLLAVFLCSIRPMHAQTTAQLSGNVADSSGAMIPRATVIIYNKDQGNRRTVYTNGTGEYIAIALPSGHYNITVQAKGFETLITNNVKLDVAQAAALDFKLKTGSANQSVTVDGTNMALNTTDGAVSTVIGRELIENMPLNGKDLQTLFELSPGTILNAGGTPNNGGGFSVDGQRPTANYLTIDGASGNAYVPVQADGGPNVTGATIATSASGGTNGILPVDAIEEYRMDTSTYTAENGRTPGGQIQVRTRSGSNSFHGTLFENFRNQVLDDTDWFVKYNGLTQLPLRMNDFGGTLGGPIRKNTLFFFVAHDTLLLNQPTTSALQDVPDASLIQNAYPAFKAFMAAFPVGNQGADPNNPGFDFFSGSFPYQIRDHTTSVRIDAQLPHSIHTYFRANIAPSTSYQPGLEGIGSQVHIYTFTGGVTIPIGPRYLNELTVNQTSVNTNYRNFITSTGGNNTNAIQDNLPTGVNAATDNFGFELDPPKGRGSYAEYGPQALNELHQWNIVDGFSWQSGRHTLKIGGDFLLHQTSLTSYINEDYLDVVLEKQPPYTDLDTGLITYLDYTHTNSFPTVSVKNLSLYVNDDWRVTSTLTLNGGVRWEYNPAPSIGPLGVLALQGASLDPATITASVSNQALYANRLTNFAPRFGFSWQIRNTQNLNTVLRGGIGTYFDTGQAATASQAVVASYPYISNWYPSTPQSYQQLNWANLSGATADALPESKVTLVDPQLNSPRTYEWSLTLEQQLGQNTKLSASYVGNDGEKLVGENDFYNAKNSAGQYPVNPALVSKNGNLYLLTNQSHSNYQAFQLQLTSRVGQRLNVLASYTWGHAEDNGSTDFSSVGALALNPLADSANDLRHIFASAIHYAPRGLSKGSVVRSITSGWAIDTIARLQTAPPFTVEASYSNPTAFLPNADVVPNQPTVLKERYDSSGRLIPGGKLLNFNAFTAPPSDSLGNPLRQGNSPTNGYRLFGLTQWDLAASRSWRIWENLNLNFRIDAFNVLNIPNFSDPENDWYSTANGVFGRAQNTYASFFGSTPANHGATGAQLNVFQNGGPREVQLSMKLKF